MSVPGKPSSKSGRKRTGRPRARGVYALVTKIYDGDTLTIVYTGKAGGKDKVRLIGVDARN